VSPDGRWLAFQYFVKDEPGSVQIWVMEISKGFESARRLACQFKYAGEMSWSPDSEWISFISPEDKTGRSTSQIYKVNITTNDVLQVTNFPEGTVIGDSTTWSTVGRIGFEKAGVIYSVPQSGGEETQVLDARKALSNRQPKSIRLSPNGKMLLFSIENAEQDQSSIWVANLESKSVQQLTALHFDLFPAWIDNGNMLFTRMTKKEFAEIQAFSLRTRKIEQLTSRHVDFTPSAAPSGRVLFFSRKGQVSTSLEKGDFFAGYHVWRLPLSRSAGGGRGNAEANGLIR
jgi:Tol biopolymer transport system component